MTRNQQRVLIVMAACVVLLVVFLLASLLVFSSFGGGSGGGRRGPTIKLQPPTATPAPPVARPAATSTARPTVQAPTAQTRGTTIIRSVPDPNGPVIARLPAGLSLPITGRSADDAWLLVLFSSSAAVTPRAGAPDTASGWLATSTVELAGDIDTLPILAAPAPPPTSSPRPTPSPSPTASPTPTRTPSASPTATRAPLTPAPPMRALPDLVLHDFGVITQGAGAGNLRVDIGNVGQADLTGQPIEIIGVDQTGAEVLHMTTQAVSIGRSNIVTITTNYRPAMRTLLTVAINPNGAILEADAPPGFADSNNALTKVVNPLP